MLCAIEQYYKENCDGIWEHSYGFTIESCDNPGWLIKINDHLLFKVLDALKIKKENNEKNIYTKAKTSQEMRLMEGRI